MANDAQVLDFTNVKDGGGLFKKTRQPEGDYRGKITKVATVAKKDDKKVKQWLFTIEVGKGIYPFYCGFEENVLWKIRNLFVAAGMTVPKKKLKIDPNKIVGKEIGVTLEDDEYNNKAQSSIAATFPTSELEDEDEEDEDEDEDEEDSDEEDEDDEDSEDEDDEEDEDDDEEEEEETPPPKKSKTKAAPAKGKKKKADLDELDIEDI